MSGSGTTRGAIAISWFDPATYPETRAAMTDAGALPAAYADWLISAEQVEGELKRVGFEVRRVAVEADAFLAWCREVGREPDGKARSAYATARAGA